MKLWHVELTYTAVVLADDYMDALHVARDNDRDIISDSYDYEIDVTELKDMAHLKRIGSSFDADALPYIDRSGDSDNRTIEQIFTELAARPPTPAELEATGQTVLPI